MPTEHRDPEVPNQEPQPAAATVLLAFHFPPSPEVGARRMSALARHLRAKGHRVMVVSAFEGLQTLVEADKRSEQLRGYQLIRVPIPSEKVLALLVRSKDLLRRLGWASPATQPALSPAAASPATQPTLSPALARLATSVKAGIASVRRFLLDVIYLIDDRKRWSWQAARRILQAPQLPRATVMIVSAPPVSPLLAAIVAGRRLGFPVIVDLRDPIYLQTEHGTADHRFHSQWGRRTLERYVLRRAAHITTTSPSLRDHLQTNYPEIADRISCIYNSFEGDPAPPLASTGNRLVIVYAGALYLNRDPFPFLEAVGDLLGRPDVDKSRVEVVFAGECEDFRGISLRGWLAERAWADAVTIHPKLGAAELGALYERATLLINFAEGQRMQIPAKTFELLALGRELLVLCEPQSDTAVLVRGITGVSCTQSGDPRELRALLQDIYRRHVDHGTLRAPSPREISRYSPLAQHEQFARLIERLRSDVADRR